MKDNMSSDAVMMNAYGLYLANGGTPDGFMDMTLDDVQMMYTSYNAMNRNNSKNIIMGIAKIMGRMFGEEE